MKNTTMTLVDFSRAFDAIKSITDNRESSSVWANLQIITSVLDLAENELLKPSGRLDNYQRSIHKWMVSCFGPEIARDRMERNFRFLEEALELFQSQACSRQDAHRLVDYVFDRPVGDLHQEVGGVMVTLMALCNAAGLSADGCGEMELERISDPGMIAKIRAEKAAKDIRSPLPGQPDKPEDLPRSITLTRAEIQTLLMAYPPQQVASLLSKIASWYDGKEVIIQRLHDYSAGRENHAFVRVCQWLNDYENAQVRNKSKLDDKGEFYLDDIRTLVGHLASCYSGQALVSLIKLHAAASRCIDLMDANEGPTYDFLKSIVDEANLGLGKSPDGHSTAKLVNDWLLAKAGIETLSSAISEFAKELNCQNDNEDILQAIRVLKACSKVDVETMVNRFLSWKLPANFMPDGGISFEPYYKNGTFGGGTRKPTGTNLLDATQARAMVLHMLTGEG
jgi:hypothetical protein